MRPGAARGFTLLEVLVTVVILAVLASVLALSVGAGDDEQVLRRETERLAARLSYACERAELSGRDVGLHVRGGGYAFSVMQGEGWRFIEDDAALSRVEFRAPLAATLVDAETPSAFTEMPQWRCFASGETTSMAVELATAAAATRWRIDSAPDGGVQVRHRTPQDDAWQLGPAR